MESSHAKKRSMKIIGIALISMWLLSAASYFTLDTIFAYSNPTAPRPKSGEIYPISTDRGGPEVYLTATQDELMNSIDFIWPVLFAAAMVFNLGLDPFGWREKMKPRKLYDRQQ